MQVCFTCAAPHGPGPHPSASDNGLPKRSCAPRSFRPPTMRLNRSQRDEPDLPDDLPLVKHPLAGELSFAQIVQSITRGIE